MKTLASRPDPTSIVAILKQVSLKSMAWVGVYLLGYFNFSIGWMVTPLLLRYTKVYLCALKFSELFLTFFSKCSEGPVEKAEKEPSDSIQRGSPHKWTGFLNICHFIVWLFSSQAMLESRMGAEDLPSWVFFPDKDRAEWMNTILKQVSHNLLASLITFLFQLWPYVNNYVRGMLFDTVEPLVNDALKYGMVLTYYQLMLFFFRGFKLNPFKFNKDRVFLGQVPPRITGIKVYDENTSRWGYIFLSNVMQCNIPITSSLERRSLWIWIWCLQVTWRLNLR